MKLDPKQQQAVELMLNARQGIITGPPGVGKTTCIREALAQLPPSSYALCAPTGKAAKRMTEATGAPAQTIHRLLQWSRGRFTRNAFDPLDQELVICDESSMLDLFLAADLTAACSESTRVIFVGDANQLPPVGPGLFFRDAIASGKVPTVVLETLHRAAQGSWIYRNAPNVLAGRGVEMEDCGDFEWHVGDDGDSSYLIDAVVAIIRTIGLEHTQVLTPMRVRDGGAYQLNQALQKEFNPGKGGFTVGYGDTQMQLRPGDHVIQTKNDYQLQVFNGETGVVQHISGGRVVVAFDDEEREYDNEQARNLELSYAVTVHKFQGSEEANIVFICHSEHGFMLNRQLLYTAITRAKKRVFIVGDEKGFKSALATVASAARVTRLKERILSLCP